MAIKLDDAQDIVYGLANVMGIDWRFSCKGNENGELLSILAVYGEEEGVGFEYDCSHFKHKVDVFDSIVSYYLKNFKPLLEDEKCGKEYVDDFMNNLTKEKILDNVSVLVLNKAANEDNMTIAPTDTLLDLVVYYQIVIENKCGILITYDMMRKYGISLEGLEEAARGNYKNFRDFDIDRIGDIPEADDIEAVKDYEMYSIAANCGSFSSTILYYTEILQDLSDKVNDDLIVLPCNATLFMVVAICDYDGIVSFYKRENQSNCPSSLFVSENIYKYSRDTGEISIFNG